LRSVLVWPSPKSQRQDCSVPVEVSVKMTVDGAMAVLGETMNDAGK
jgi:hypothetical protein